MIFLHLIIIFLLLVILWNVYSIRKYLDLELGDLTQKLKTATDSLENTVKQNEPKA